MEQGIQHTRRTSNCIGKAPLLFSIWFITLVHLSYRPNFWSIKSYFTTTQYIVINESFHITIMILNFSVCDLPVPTLAAASVQYGESFLMVGGDTTGNPGLKTIYE
jgi:hypothetical protein